MSRSALPLRFASTLLPLVAPSLPLLADGDPPHNTTKSATMDYGPVMATTVVTQNAKGFADLNRVAIKGLPVSLEIPDLAPVRQTDHASESEDGD